MEKPDSDEIIKDMLIDQMIDETEMCKSCGKRMKYDGDDWICEDCGFIA